MKEADVKKAKANLAKGAAKKGFGKERTGAYVFGTLRKLGWKPSREKKSA